MNSIMNYKMLREFYIMYSRPCVNIILFLDCIIVHSAFVYVLSIVHQFYSRAEERIYLVFNVTLPHEKVNFNLCSTDKIRVID